MPNHIKNRLELKGSLENINSIIEKFFTIQKSKLRRAYDGSIICHNGNDVGWFNERTGVFTTTENREGVVGLPEGFNMGISNEVFQFPDFNKIIPQPSNIFNGDLGQKEEEMCKKEGRPTWYEWNRKNWGTKWNSYSCEREAINIFSFETAWNSVPHLIEKMHEAFPEVEIIYEYADEDTGYNCGKYHFISGSYTSHLPEGGSVEAYELAFKIRPDHKEYYELVDGEYVCKDE